MKILSLSAYEASSHRYWQRSLERLFPEWDWRVLALPPRHFSWRVRGNSLYWALQQRQLLEGDHDVLLATSMVDLATLRGLVPVLARLPTLLYFHENQFAYPHNQRHGLLEAQMVSLYSALAADRVLFNSTYNRHSYLTGCGELLAKLPDFVPPGVVTLMEEKSAVLPVPVQFEVLQQAPAAWPGRQGDYPARPLRLVWASRFEYDKGGEGLWRILGELATTSLDFELALVGQQFRNSPEVFAQIQADWGNRIVQFGFLEDAGDYHSLLRGADILVSTALHEFQGLAALEAVAAGCLPVVPDRLAYREIYPAEFRYRSDFDNPELEAAAAARLICKLAAALARGSVEPPDVSAFGFSSLSGRYAAEFSALAAAPG